MPWPSQGTSNSTRSRKARRERQLWAQKIVDRHPNPAGITAVEVGDIVDLRVAEVCK